MTMKRHILFLFILPALLSPASGIWQRNTFPSERHLNAGFFPGHGWDHVDNACDLAASPIDPGLIAFADNEWSAVISEDGINFRSLNTPHTGSPGCSIQGIEFSRWDSNIIYLLLAHDAWKNISPELSPAGIWRSLNRGETWEHIYKIPAGDYEHTGNGTGRRHILEDPARSNHLWFGSTSHGIMRSVDGGLSWENAVPELADRRIKTLASGADENGQTFIYAIAEKKMPRHTAGNTVPIDTWAFPDYTARWRLNQNQSRWDASGNGFTLTGDPSAWNDSGAEGAHAAYFDGTKEMTIPSALYNTGSRTTLTVAAWFQTTELTRQSFVSFDSQNFWELGTDAGRVYWSVCGTNGAVVEISSPADFCDGEWHHISAVFNAGMARIYIDGEETVFKNCGFKTYGINTAGNGSIGKSFIGSIDDVKIYTDRALNLNGARGLYLEKADKNPVAQGMLWRITVNAAGTITDTVRLFTNYADICDVEVNPDDSSCGWLIRKGFPNAWPYGGRELWRFSDYGETEQLMIANPGESLCFREVAVNPADTNHVILLCGGSFGCAFRYSLDGGQTWKGTNRISGESIPSLQSMLPRNSDQGVKGFHADASSESMGRTTAFIAGNSTDVLWVVPFNGGLMRSTNSGASFITSAAGGPNKDLCQFAVCAGNPDFQAAAVYEYGFVITTNGGKSWRGATYENVPVFDTLTEDAENAGDWWTAARTAGGIAIHPQNPARMIGSWTRQGYIVISDDFGKTWTYSGVRNPMAQLVDVYWCASDSSRVYFGRMKSSDSGATWEDIDKCVIAVSSANPDILAGIDAMQTDVSTNLNLYLSVDGGENWTTLPPPPMESVPGLTGTSWAVTGTGRKWNHLAGGLIAFDPRPEYGVGNLRILLAGRSGIYEYSTGNAAAGWRINATGLELNPHFNELESVPWMGFVAFDSRAGYGNVVYASKIMDDRTMCNWASEANPNHAYPGGENSEPFYRSVDGGVTWEKLHGVTFSGAPRAAMVHSIVTDSSGRFYAATCHGIYIFSDSSSAMNDYEEWKSRFSWASPADAEFDADPDGDGCKNAIEYATGTDPLNPDDFFSPEFDFTHSLHPAYSFFRASSFFNYSLMLSTNLTDWFEQTVPSGPGNAQLRVPLPAGYDRLFVRLRIGDM